MPLITDKSRKWIITIFMSFLMIAFALPSYFGSQNRVRRDTPVATVFGQNMSDAELEQGKAEWNMVRSAPFLPGQDIPLTVSMFITGDIQTLAQLDMNAAQETFLRARLLEAGIAKDPKLFSLLKREAARQGITPSSERVEAMLVNQIRLPEGTQEQVANSWRQACTDFLAVQAMIQQAANAVKVSRPVVQSAIATQLQSLSLNVVLLDANEFRSKVPAPTDAALQSLFAAHRDQLPNAAITGEAAFGPDNYGFGYRRNDGVRLEYIALSRPELARAAKASKSAHDWDVEGNRYYLQNRSQFNRVPTPPPTTSPASQPASTQPVQQTYAQVRDEILNQLYETKTEQLKTQVERRLTQLLSTDYRQYADAKLKGVTPPPSSVGTPVGAADYLRAIASKIEKETGVLPEVTTFGDRYLDAPAFDREEIGRATLADAAGAAQGNRGPTLGAFLLNRAKPFFQANAAARRDPGATALENLEPTPVFTTGESGTRPVIIARVLDARTAATLPFEDVREQVREDAIQQAATEAAHSAAEAFLASASKSSLASAASVDNRTVIAAPSVTYSPASLPAQLFSLSQTSQATFVRAAFNLLRDAPKPGQSRALVSLPRDRKVAVIELENTQPLVPGVEPAALELDMQFARRLSAVNEFLFAFLQPDAILARTQFVDLTGKAKPATSQPLAQK